MYKEAQAAPPPTLPNWRHYSWMRQLHTSLSRLLDLSPPLPFSWGGWNFCFYEDFLICYPFVTVTVIYSINMYTSPFLKSTESRTPHTPSECVRKISASGTRFCRQYKRDCLTHPSCLQLGRERGLPGLLCTFNFSGWPCLLFDILLNKYFPAG